MFFDVQFHLDFVPKNVAYQLDLFNYSHKQKHKNAANVFWCSQKSSMTNSIFFISHVENSCKVLYWLMSYH